MITKKDLQKKLEEIAAITGEATSEQDAISKGKDKYLYLEYASVYGGYRVVNVRLKSGSHSGAFNGNGIEARLKAKDMWSRLTAILTGLELSKSLNK